MKEKSWVKYEVRVLYVYVFPALLWRQTSECVCVCVCVCVWEREREGERMREKSDAREQQIGSAEVTLVLSASIDWLAAAMLV